MPPLLVTILNTFPLPYEPQQYIDNIFFYHNSRLVLLQYKNSYSWFMESVFGKIIIDNTKRPVVEVLEENRRFPRRNQLKLAQRILCCSLPSVPSPLLPPSPAARPSLSCRSYFGALLLLFFKFHVPLFKLDSQYMHNMLWIINLRNYTSNSYE